MRLKLMLFIMLSGLAGSLHTAWAADISGVVWNDANTNGIREVGESGIDNIFVSLFDAASNFIDGATSASGGSYAMTTNVTAGSYFLRFNPPAGFDATVKDAGADDTVDSDVMHADGLFVTDAFPLQPGSVTNVDAGFYQLGAAIDVSFSVNGQPLADRLYPTSGQTLTFKYAITNSGGLPIVDVFLVDFNGFETRLCPAHILEPGESTTFTSVYTAAVSTNLSFTVFVGAGTVFCELIGDPIEVLTNTAIEISGDVIDQDHDGIPTAWEDANGLSSLASNAPGSNADADWMTDVEEFRADTDPTNEMSFFPDIVVSNAPVGTMNLVVSPSSTERVYHVRWTTNLLDDPQNWMYLPPEQTGSGSSLIFTVTNDSPGKSYRTGVRLP